MNKLRGHKIEYINNQWVYSDTKEPTAETWQDRPCGHCGLHNTSEGHDGCLGTLPIVMNACCGHGQMNEAYVQFHGRSIVSGMDAISLIKRFKESVE